MPRRGLIPIALAALIGVAGAWPAAAQSPGAPTVETEMPVTAVDLRLSAAYNSPAVVLDPSDPRFAVVSYRRDTPSYGCGLAVSGDGGQRWAPANPVPKLPAGAEECYAPEVAFDRSGTLYYLFVGLAGPGHAPMGAFLTTSDDYGRTFTAPRPILGPHVFGVRMVLDTSQGKNGRIHVVWIQANSPPALGAFPTPPNPVMAAFSDDGGETFSSPVQVSDPQRQYVVAPSVVLGSDSALHVLYYDLEDDIRDYQGLAGPVWDGTWSLVLSTSTDGGRTFGGHSVVEADVVPPERVQLIFTMPPASLAADGRGGLHVTWYDARNGDWDVFDRRSTDGGRSWSEPRRVNDDPVGNGRHQYLPRLSVAPGGRVDVVFYDRRDDTENARNHVSYTWSTDGGTTFAPNLRLTTEPSDHRIGVRYVGPAAEGLIEFGSRLGLASTEERAIAAWTDTRLVATGPDDPPGQPPLAKDQNIFAIEVLFGPRRLVVASSDSSPPWGAIGGVAVVGVAFVMVLAVRARNRRRVATRGAGPTAR